MTAEQTVAVLLAGTQERRRRRATDVLEALATIDYEPLAEQLRRQRMLALIGTRVRELLGARAPPPWFCELVDEELRRARQVATAQILAGMQVHSALERAGIEALALKGPFLATRLYGDPALRSSADIDVLVRAECLHAAVGILRGLGYDPPRDPPEAGGGLPMLHYAMRHGGGLPPVDLHWRVHWYETSFAVGALDRSVAAAGEVRRASPRDELTILLLIYAREGFQGLRLAADLGAWCDTFGAQWPVEAVVAEVSAEHPALRGALAAAAIVAERVVGLQNGRCRTEALSRRERRAIRLTDWALSGVPAQIEANRSLADALLAPAATTTGRISRSLFPPAAVLRERNTAGMSAAHIRFAQLETAARVLRRWLIAWAATSRGRALGPSLQSDVAPHDALQPEPRLRPRG